MTLSEPWNFIVTFLLFAPIYLALAYGVVLTIEQAQEQYRDDRSNDQFVSEYVSPVVTVTQSPS